MVQVALDQGVGYGIVIGLGAAFALGTYSVYYFRSSLQYGRDGADTKGKQKK